MKHTIHRTARIGVLSVVIISMVVSGVGGFVDITPVDEVQAQTATEDLTTYTEYDPNNRITINSSEKITITDFGNNVNARLFKNSSDLAYRDISIEYNFTLKSGSSSGSVFTGLELENNTQTNNDHAGLLVGDDGTLTLKNHQGASDIGSISYGNTKYVELDYYDRNATMILKIYNDSAKTNLEYKENRTYNPVRELRYFYVAQGTNTGTDGSLKATFGNVKLETGDINGNAVIDSNAVNFSTFYTQDDAGDALARVGENDVRIYDADASNQFRIKSSAESPKWKSQLIQFNFISTQNTSVGHIDFGLGNQNLSSATSIHRPSLGGIRHDGSATLQITAGDTGSTFGSYDLGKNYYVNLYHNRLNMTLTYEVYSDYERTNLLYNKTSKIGPSHEYDELYAAIGRGGSSSGTLDAIFRNMRVYNATHPTENTLDPANFNHSNNGYDTINVSSNELAAQGVGGNDQGHVWINVYDHNDKYSPDAGALFNTEPQTLQFELKIGYIEDAGRIYAGWGDAKDAPENNPREVVGMIVYGSSMYLSNQDDNHAKVMDLGSYDGPYFINITGDGAGTLSMYVYSDKERTNEIANTTQSYNESKTYEYLFMSGGENANPSGYADYTIRNFRTQDVTLESRQIFESIGDTEITGKVTDINNNPIENATVELLDVNSNDEYTTQTNATGEYSVEVSSETNYSAWYSKRGYERETVYIEPQTQTTYDVSLQQKTPALYGYVYDNTTGSTIPGANITAWYEDSNGILIPVETQTDLTGYYEVQLDADYYNVTVTKQNYKTKYNDSWYIDEDTQRDWYIDPQGNNTVSGYVTDTQGQAIEGATIQIGQNYSIESDAQGYYELLVPDGTYNLTASKQGYQDDTYTSQSITSDATYDFTLNGTVTYSVNGYVHNDKGDPIDNAVIYVSNDSAVVETASTDPSGYYSLSGLTEGSYTFNATKNLYQNDSAYLYIALDDIQNFTLRAEREMELEAPDVIWENSESDYNVTLLIPAYRDRVDVTDQATVTSSNTTILTVDSANHSLQSYSYKGNVTVNATYNNYDDNMTIIVANQTAENVGLFKDWGQMTAAIWGNPVNPDTGEAPGGTQLTMAMLFVALLVGIALSSWASAFAGIGGITVTVVFGWMMGWVGDGMVLVTLFTGLFIGLNLAANVDYEMRN